MSPRTVLAGLVAAASLAGAPAAEPAAAGPASPGKVFLTQDEALKLAFPRCAIERETFFLTEKQEKRVAERGGSKLASAIVYVYTARDEKGRIAGRAWFDTHKVRTLRETLMIVLDEGGRVVRVEVLAFAEPQEYLPRGNWYAQFRGKRLGKDLRLERDIHGVTGATLTARATTSAVRRTLALHEVVFGRTPALARR